MTFLNKLFNRKEQSAEKKEKATDITDLADGAFDENSSLEEASEQTESEEEDPNMEYEVVEREILPAKIICPDCGGITLEGLDFCDKCGGEL